MLNLLDEFIIRLIACVTVCSCQGVMTRFATIWVTSSTSFTNASAICERLLLVRKIRFLSRIGINLSWVAAIGLVSVIVVIIIVWWFIFSFLVPHLWIFFSLLGSSWAVWFWLVLWSALRGLVLIGVIININVNILNINWNHFNRLVPIDIRRACSPGSTFSLNLNFIITGLATLLDSTFFSCAAQMVNILVVDLLIINEILCLGITIFLWVSLSSGWDFSFLHLIFL